MTVEALGVLLDCLLGNLQMGEAMRAGPGFWGVWGSGDGDLGVWSYISLHVSVFVLLFLTSGGLLSAWDDYEGFSASEVLWEVV